MRLPPWKRDPQIASLLRNYSPAVMNHDAKYLSPLKSWQYGASRARRSKPAQDRDWRSMDEIRTAFPTRNLAGRGLPIASQPTARDRLIRLVKKVRKKSGKTYYQRAQFRSLEKSIAATPLSAKRYVSGVDFSYRMLG